MILTFAAENYRSILGRQEISFVASRFKGHDDALHQPHLARPGILPVLVIYGANAAGKTSLLKAMEFLREAIENSHTKWQPNARINHQPHFFHRDRPSTLEIEFLMGSDDYRYGFSASATAIEREWMYSGRVLLFERHGSDFRFGSRFRGAKAVRTQTRPTALFLSTAAQNNNPLLSPIYEWFSNWMMVVDTDRMNEMALAALVLQTEETRKFIAAAVGVVNQDIVSVAPPPESEAAFNDLPEHYRPTLTRLQSYSKTIFTHIGTDGQRAELQLDEESRGTQTFFHLIGPVIISLVNGRPLVIDEMDASLHPSLLRAIVMLFQSKETNPKGSQLIFNTHDTTLLTPELLRPDQVVFVEKDQDSGSRFLPLNEFEGIRSDTRVQRAYLEGRFGALPFLDRLCEVFIQELVRVGARGSDKDDKQKEVSSKTPASTKVPYPL